MKDSIERKTVHNVTADKNKCRNLYGELSGVKVYSQIPLEQVLKFPWMSGFDGPDFTDIKIRTTDGWGEVFKPILCERYGLDLNRTLQYWNIPRTYMYTKYEKLGREARSYYQMRKERIFI